MSQHQIVNGTGNDLSAMKVNSDGSININDNQLTQTFEYNGDNLILYQGESSPGTSKGAASWRIKKLSYSGTNVVDIQWADGTNNFTKVWNDRATYTYS